MSSHAPPNPLDCCEPDADHDLRCDVCGEVVFQCEDQQGEDMTDHDLGMLCDDCRFEREGDDG